MDLDALRAIPDPVARVAAADEAAEELATLRRQVAEVKREAVIELHAALGGYGAVGKALGLSRARAQQLAKPLPPR